MPILYVRDSKGNFVAVPGIIGPRGEKGQGTSAYEAAKEAGYTGTEEEFNAALADIENKASKTEAQAMADTAETNAKAASDPKGSAAAAQKAAIAAAAEDATTKANNAQSNAVASAKTYTDTEIGKTNANVTANANAIATVKTSVENLTTEVSDKANAADVVPKAGATMTGALTAYGGDVAVAQARNVYFGTTDLTAGSASTQPEGTMYFKYE